MNKNRAGLKARLFEDVLRIFFFAIIGGLAALAALSPHSLPYLLIDLGLRFLIFSCVEVLVIAIVRELIPKPEPGAHIIGFNRAYVRWLLSSTLVNVAMHPVFRIPFWSFHMTRILYLKALGAEIAWTSGVHEHVIIREPSLLKLGPGAQLEPGVIVEAAFRRAGRIRISEVIVGARSVVGAHAKLMPGATLGHDVRIEPAALVGEDVHVGVGATIEEGVRLQKGVDLGSYTTVGTGAILSVGAQVGDRTKIAPGSVVARDTKIGEREFWQGAPARAQRLPQESAHE